jgi:hypothetical protein
VDVSQGVESVTKESNSVRAESVLAREDRDFLREDIDRRCALTAFPCARLEPRPQPCAFHAAWSGWASEPPAWVAAPREVVGQKLEHAAPS